MFSKSLTTYRTQRRHNWSMVPIAVTVLIVIALLPMAQGIASTSSNTAMVAKGSGYQSGPFGWVASSCTYKIPKNSRIVTGSNGWDKVITPSGNALQIPPCSQTLAAPSGKLIQPDFSAESGTVEYADWTYQTTSPPAIFYFDGNWQVPQTPPSTGDHQQIFLILGLAVTQNGNPHVSAGINWGGDGCAGGGAFWMESVWARDANGNEYCTPAQSVTVGDGIAANDDSLNCDSSGACDWQPQVQDTTSGYATSYYCAGPCHSAMEYSGIDLTVGNVVSCSDYPASPASFSSLQLANTNFNYITPTWNPHTDTSDGCEENITNLSPTGMTFNYDPLSCSANGSPTSGTRTVTTQFTSSCSGGFGSYSFNWNFPDCPGYTGSSTSQNPSWTFYYCSPNPPSDSVWQPTLTVTDSGGGTSHPGVPSVFVSCGTTCPSFPSP